MFQVILATNDSSEIDKLIAFLNINVAVVKSKSDRNNITFVNQFDDVYLGCLKVQPDKVVIQVDETIAEGEYFWREFVRSYPDLDPYETYFGIIYPVIGGKDGVYELEALSIGSVPTEEDLDAVGRYAQYNQAYFVRFYRGDWHAYESIKVISFEQILENGKFGPKMPTWTFDLIEKRPDF